VRKWTAKEIIGPLWVWGAVSMNANRLKLLFFSVAIIALLGLVSSPITKDIDTTNGAQWLSAEKNSPVLYFRVDVDVLGDLQYAILSLKARDEFEVWVNGNRVPSIRILGAFNSSRLDIGKFLRPGNNVLGIVVDSISRHQQAALKAVIDYKDANGRRFVATNQKWSVTALAKTTLTEEGQWALENRPDSNWEVSTVLTMPPHGSWKQSGLPWIVQPSILQGHWFWQGDLDEHQVTMHREIDYNLGSKIVLGVGVNGYYSILVNGQVWLSDTGAEGLVRLHDLSPMLRAGPNQLSLNVRANATLPKMSIVGFQQKGSQIIDLSSPSDWRFDVVDQELNVFEPLSDITPFLSYAETVYSLQYMFYFALEWFATFLSLVIFGGIILMLSIKMSKNSAAQVLSANVVLCFFMALLWSLLFILAKFNYVNFSIYQQHFIFFNVLIFAALNFNLRVIFSRGFSSNV